jgi:hypothetical protein
MREWKDDGLQPQASPPLIEGGHGEPDVALTADGQTTNTVNVNIH